MGHDGQQQNRGDRREEDQPVEEQVADVERSQRPGVGRHCAELGGQVVAVGAQSRDFGRFGVTVRDISEQGVGDFRIVVHERAPGREPAADIAAARHHRKIVEFEQDVALGQRPQDAQPERSAADAAARQAQGRAAFVFADQAVDLVVEAAQRALGRRAAVQHPEFDGKQPFQCQTRVDYGALLELVHRDHAPPPGMAARDATLTRVMVLCTVLRFGRDGRRQDLGVFFARKACTPLIESCRNSGARQFFCTSMLGARAAISSLIGPGCGLSEPG